MQWMFYCINNQKEKVKLKHLMQKVNPESFLELDSFDKDNIAYFFV